MLSGLPESLIAGKAGGGRRRPTSRRAHEVTLPMQGTGEQGQQPGVSLKAKGGRCVSHRDHPLGAPHLLQDLWLPLIGHSNPKHKPILWEDVAKEMNLRSTWGCATAWISGLPAHDRQLSSYKP